MAPGMGLNAFLAYTLVLGGKITWQVGLGVVFLSGLLCWVLTLLGLRKRLVEAIPASLISAISVGIGLFITFIGLQDLGLIVNNEATLVSAGPLTGTVAIGLLRAAAHGVPVDEEGQGRPADRHALLDRARDRDRARREADAVSCRWTSISARWPCNSTSWGL